MQMLLHVISECLALQEEILFRQQVLNNTDSQSIYICLAEVKSIQKERKVFDLWSQILPAIPILFLSF